MPTSVATGSADTASVLALGHMLGLSTGVAKAVLDGNPDVATERAALAAAQARRLAAGFVPAALLSVETEEVPGGLNVSQANTRVFVEREFLTGARRAAAGAAATSDITVAQAALAAAIHRALATAARAYVAAAGWSAVADRLTAEDSLLASAEASLRTRFAVAQARYVDVLRIRTERLRVESSGASARAEARAAVETLRGVLGGDSLPEIRGGGAPPNTLPVAPNLDSLIAASPVLRAAEAQIASAEAARALTLAGQRPIVSGFVGAQRFLQEGRGFTLGPVAGASITLPFTARRANQTAAEAAEAAVVTARLSRAATAASLRAELAAGMARYEAARERLAGYSAALLRGAQQEREAALVSYRGGELTLLELIDFERALAQAETDRVVAMIDATDALASLIAPDAATPRDATFGGTPALAATPSSTP